ncbi:MAG: hypothetical protein L6R19_01920 [Alphaproteobacteria bacterium]|nr:hypothetical protein [Alphaproteobacteria bacterium]
MPLDPSPFIVGAIVAGCAALATAVLARHVNREKYESMSPWAVIAGVALFVGVLGLSAHIARLIW